MWCVLDSLIQKSDNGFLVFIQVNPDRSLYLAVCCNQNMHPHLVNKTLTFPVKLDTAFSVIEMLCTRGIIQIRNYLGVLDPENFNV